MESTGIRTTTRTPRSRFSQVVEDELLRLRTTQRTGAAQPIWESHRVIHWHVRIDYIILSLDIKQRNSGLWSNLMSPQEQLSEYPVGIEVPVLWGDQDAFGHVNNVIYFRWFESARIAYFEKIGLFDLLSQSGVGVILASIKCDFLSQLIYPDRACIAARVTRIGNSSMTMQHSLISKATNHVSATAYSTVVTFNFEKNTSERVPDDLRRNISELEGQQL